MKRLNTMKNYLKPTAAAVALMLVAGPTSAADYFLCAGATSKTLPDGSVDGVTVPMWGYAEDDDGDLANGCGNPITVPGPQLTVPVGDSTLNITVLNNLPAPTSLVIPGLPMPVSTGAGPTWNDNSTGGRTNATQRVRSFGAEAAASGGTESYSFTVDRPGTFLYHSGTHPQNQVYMGLYGAATKDEVAEDIVTGTSAEAYPGVPYDNEVVLFYSDIDPTHNAAVAAGDLTYTPINYNAKWFLINGEPYKAGVTADIPAGLASSDPLTTSRSDTLIRFLSAASETHVPVLQGLRMTIHAEDGLQYNWQDGDTVVATAPRSQYSAMLPALKTKDAIIAPVNAGRYAVYDGNGYMTNPSDITDFAVGDEVGGMLRFLTVGDANLLPIAVNDEAVTDEDTAVLINVLANDLDPSNDPPSNLGLSIVSVTVPANGTAVITSDTCCVTYTPNANFNGTDQFDYTITDGNGVTSTATAFVQVTVTAVNDPPVIESTPPTTATTGVLYEYQVVAADPDVPPDVLAYSLTLGPVGMSIDPASGLITWTPTVQDNAASYDVTVVVTDLAGAIDTQTYTIVNTLVNVAPTIASTPVTTAIAGQAYSYDVNATDPDLGDTQTYSLDVSPAGMTIDAGTGVIDWTPTMAQLGDSTVTVTVTDFHGLTDSQTYTVTVSANTAAGALFFSNVSNTSAVPGVDGPYNNANIYAYDGVAYSKVVDFIDTMGFQANIDGLQMVDADTFYVSFANNELTTVPGIAVVQDEDVVLYDAGTWSIYFDGSICGLNTNNGQDIDAVSIVDGTLYFSTLGGGNSNPVGGVAAPYDDADVYTYSGGGANTCGRALDASAEGLTNVADIDALTLKGTTYYMSFNRNDSLGGTPVPGITDPVLDEQVVSFDGTTTWSMYFSGPGLDVDDGQDLDAVHVP